MGLGSFSIHFQWNTVRPTNDVTLEIVRKSPGVCSWQIQAIVWRFFYEGGEGLQGISGQFTIIARPTGSLSIQYLRKNQVFSKGAHLFYLKFWIQVALIPEKKYLKKTKCLIQMFYESDHKGWCPKILCNGWCEEKESLIGHGPR